MSVNVTAKFGVRRLDALQICLFRLHNKSQGGRGKRNLKKFLNLMERK
jgi:hypothetical protein